jgi:hypothetical protein
MPNDTALLPRQLLFLWHLAASGGTAFLKDLGKTAIDASERKEIVSSGLLEEIKEKIRPPQGRSQSLIKLTLTDSGWLCLSERMESPVFLRSSSTGEVLQKLLRCLSAYVKDEGLSLGSLFLAQFQKAQEMEPEAETGIPMPQGGLADRTAPLALAPLPPLTAQALLERLKGLAQTLMVADSYILISSLREELKEYRPEELDQALRDLQTDGALVLYNFDDPGKITPSVAKGALTVAGQTRHYLIPQWS